MKKLTLIGLFCLALQAAFSQMPAESFILDEPVPPGTTRDWIAGKYIMMIHGVPPETNNFHAAPDADNYVRASIDPFYIEETDEGNEFGGPPNNNSGGLVGSVSGSLTISESGAANYSMPITVPPGTSGMAPELSIIYNSQMYRGLFGEGWNLGGISIISRTASTYYYDNKMGAVSLSPDVSALSLDGMRILKVGENDDGSWEFRTEVDNISKILMYFDGEGYIDKFKVLTKSGLTKEYGYEQNSKQILGDNCPECDKTPLAWYINRITDNLGNYINFSYIQDKINGELLPDEISYTGNELLGLEPYNKIKFSYQQLDVNRVSFFRSESAPDGYAISKNTKYISYISCMSLGQQYRGYDFQYSKKGVSQKPILNRVYLWNGYLELLNPIKFEWQLVNEDKFVFNKSPLTGSFTSNQLFPGLIPADFNYNGRADFISTWYNDGDEKWEFAINHDNPSHPNEFSQKGERVLPEDFDGLGTSDFNGDGESDLIVTYKEGDKSMFHCYIGEKDEPDGLFGPYPAFEEVITTKDVTFYNGDYNGDGIEDVMIRKHEGQYNRHTLFLYFGQPNGLPTEFIEKEIFEYFSAIPIDFNGDGKTELLLYNSTGQEEYSYVLSLNNEGTLFECKELTTTNLVQEGDKILSADFNGDRKSDLLVSNNTTNWKLYFSTGNDFIQGTILDKYNFYDDNCNIGDFNSDGLADIAITPRYSNEGASVWNGIKIWLAKDDGTDFEEIDIEMNEKPDNNDDTKLVFGDFNGNGRMDFISQEGDISNPNYFIYEIMEDIDGGDRNLITKITNGFGDDISLNYEPITNYSVYDNELPDGYKSSDNRSINEHITGFIGSLYVVSNTEHDINTGTERNGFKYYAAKTHRYGKGFLGFSMLTQTDLYSFKKRTDFYSLNYDYIYMEHDWSLLYKGEFIHLPEKVYEATENEYGYIQTTTNTKIFYPYIHKSASYLKDDRGGNAKTTKSEATFNKYADCLTTKVLHHPGFADINYPDTYFDNREYSVNTYKQADEEKWVLGRLEGSTVTKQLNVEEGDDPQPDIIKHSAFDYYLSSSIHYGMLRKEIIEPGNEKSTSKEYFYDEYGNILKTIVSASGMPLVINETKYDTDLDTGERKGRFLTWMKNTLGYISTKTYDQYSGLVKTITDPNNLITSFYYGEFGALEKVVLPDNNINRTLIRWVDNENPGSAPENSIYFVWEKSSGQTETVTYYDKLNRPLRTKTIGFSGSEVLSDINYNNIGLVLEKYEPYYKDTGPYRYIEYTYDDRHRIKTETNQPGNTTKSYEFDGLETTITNALEQNSTVKVNAAGWIVYKTENTDNSIKYIHNSAGELVKSFIVGFPETTKTFEYDIFGRKSLETDPALGEKEYTYDAFGNLKSIKHNGDIELTNVLYDNLSRMTHKEEPGVGTTDLKYDEGHLGLLDEVAFTDIENNYFANNYYYDSYGRQTEDLETISYMGESNLYRTAKVYDVYGRQKQLFYPSGFSISYKYNPQGYMGKVTQDDNGSTLWELTEMNAIGQIEKYKLGNGLETGMTYYQNTGYLKHIGTVNPNNPMADEIQSLNYGWDDIGNFKWREKRWNHSQNYLKESFYYDSYNRLIETYLYNGEGTILTETGYDKLGRMLYKRSDIDLFHVADNFIYEGDGDNNPYNIYQIDNLPPYYNALEQNIDYTTFDKVSHINQEEMELDIIYGIGHSRAIQIVEDSEKSTLEKKVYVNGLYEEINENGIEKQVHYISALDGLFAIYTMDEVTGSSNMMYVHKDHLGSIQSLTNSNGELIQEFSFDAWGLRRDPRTFIPYQSVEEYPTDLGFTGHEHIDAFTLINMNGRMYDPVTGSFLSPDPFGTSVMFSQGFNPYIYVLNNPLSSIDPSGYWNISLGDSPGEFFYNVMGTVAVLVISGSPGGPLAGALAAGMIFAGNNIHQATINGGTYNEIAAAGVKGFIVGFISSYGSYGVGKLLGPSTNSTLAKELLRAYMHGVVQGTARVIGGGKFHHGFFAGFAASISASYQVGPPILNDFVVPIIVGGTAEVISGGKFANGAYSAAFVVMFNHMQHNGGKKPNVIEYDNESSAYLENWELQKSTGKEHGGFLFKHQKTGEKLWVVDLDSPYPDEPTKMIWSTEVTSYYSNLGYSVEGLFHSHGVIAISYASSMDILSLNNETMAVYMDVIHFGNVYRYNKFVSHSSSGSITKIFPIARPNVLTKNGYMSVYRPSEIFKY